MSEPRRSTRARAREEAAPVPETPKEKETPAKGAKSTLKRKRTSVVVKDPTPSTPGIDTVPQTPKQTLPLRLVDGQPLPTLPEPQPLDLPTGGWQDIQQSGVLGASLERSRAVWVSGVNFRVFHKHFTQPKKPADRTEEDKAKQQRQKDLFKNFPELGKDINNTKDTIEIQAQLVVEPHTFPIRLYAPREMIKHAQKKPAPTYGHWPNHSQPQHSHPNQHTQYNNFSQPPYQQRPPAPKPPPPKPVHKPQPTPSAASAPAPDPVIHALAQRAGTDPELKSVMKIVAAGQASKAQLEFFQNHINELTAMLAKQKEAPKASVPPPTPGPNLPASTPKPISLSATPKSTPQPSAPKVSSQSPAPPVAASTPMPKPAVPASAQSRATPSVPVSPLVPTVAPSSSTKPTPLLAATQTLVPPPIPRPVQPAQTQQNVQYAPKSFSPAPPQGYMQQQPSMRPSQGPYPTQYGHPQQPYNPPRQMYHAPPPPVGYRPLVFSFEEGNKDLLHFPSYSFMEWLPNMSGAKFSFLVTRLKPKPETDAGLKPPSTPAPHTTPAQPPTPASNMTPGQPSIIPAQGNQIAGTPGQVALAPGTPVTPTPYVPPPRIEDFDEKNDVPEINFYQPVTVLLLTDNNDIRQALLRAIRPSDVVEKYMDEVFDKCKRAQETYLAFRLPKDGDTEVPEKRVSSGDGTPVMATPTQDVGHGGFGTNAHGGDKKKAGRPRRGLV